MMSGGAGLVSIIVPTFNDGRWLADAVDSALAQTYSACEIIIIDDGSTDGTQTLVSNRYRERVKFIRQPNRGHGAARNTGLAAATGEYVQFLDADDVLFPGKVAAHVAALQEHPDYCAVYSDYAFVDETLAGTDEAAPVRDGDRSGPILGALLQDNFIVIHAPLSRLSDVRAVGGFDETLAACEDYDLWLRLAAAGRPFLYIPGESVLYRRRSGSVSTDRHRQIAGTLEAVAKVPGYASLTDQDERIRRRRVTALREMMVRSLALDAWTLLRRGRPGPAAVRLFAAARHGTSVIPRVCARVAARTLDRVRRAALAGVAR